MSTVVTFNNQSFVVPATGEVGWGNNVSAYLIAIAAGALQKSGGSFTLSAETDFGGAFGLKSLYYRSESSNIASSGIFRLNNNSDAVSWRNAANSGNLPLTVNSSDQLAFNGIPIGGAAIFTANRAIVSNGSGNLDVSVTTSTEIGFVSGVTSAIQTQLNGKQATLTTGNLTDVGTDGIVVTGGTGSVIGTGTSLAQHVADVSHNGYLSSTDWSTFNSKQTALNTLTSHFTLVGNGAGNVTLISPSTAGFVLTSNGGSSDPSFQPVSGSGTVSPGTTPRLAYYATSSNIVSDTPNITFNGSGKLSLLAASNDSSELGLSNGSGTLILDKYSSGFVGTVNGLNAADQSSIITGNALLISAGHTSGSATDNTISLGINNVEKVHIDDVSGVQIIPELYTVAYQDYSGTSTIVGWTSFTLKSIFYKRVGKTVYVTFALSGTSNSISTTFTLPFTSSNDVATRVVANIMNNGTAAFGRLTLNANSSTVTCSPDAGGGDWTNSGTKTIIAQFFYQAA